ncbi:MAG: CarD family transcriptional regulator [Spirochaetaceae bacterium]|nr:CarD family transcriptional regulator [Spirochaetaceae bacterium]
MAKKISFKVDDVLVYPGQGVGTITEISDIDVGDEVVTYYVVYLREIDMTVLIPIDKAEERGLRHIVSKKEATQALEFLSNEPTNMPSDWKLRYQMNMDLFKSGKILDICTVIRSLYHRGKMKDLPIQEKKLYESSYKILQDEISAALKISLEEAEVAIHKALEPFPQTEQKQGEHSDEQNDYDEFEDVFEDELSDDDMDD